MFAKKLFAVLLVVSACWTSQQAIANDSALYEKAIDPNAAFVRAVTDEQVALRLGGKSFAKLDNGVSPYVVVDPGKVPLSIGSIKSELDVQPGKFYSAIYRAGKELVVIEDKVQQSPAKANLSFYNLTNQNSMDLFVPQAKANAVAGLAIDKGRTIQLKAPLTLDFAVSKDGESKATVEKLKLVRGSGLTLVALEKNGKISLLAINSKIAK